MKYSMTINVFKKQFPQIQMKWAFTDVAVLSQFHNTQEGHVNFHITHFMFHLAL